MSERHEVDMNRQEKLETDLAEEEEEEDDENNEAV